MAASLKHILLSFEEYERLKHIESEYHKLQTKLDENLHLPSKFKFVKLCIIKFCNNLCLQTEICFTT